MCGAAVFLALCSAGAASAQTATDNTPLSLDKIIVTGTAHKVTKMKSSVSVSTLNADQIRTSGATSAADVLRSVPGIQSQSTGGDSNANITVRGLPVSAGGMRYVAMEQDGLPILDFGDIAFATPDSFERIDGLLSQVQVVRGGTGSTLATNAPGGIINFISNTGELPNASVGFKTGLGYNENRADFNYGGPINATNRFEIAGFYHYGQGGPRNTVDGITRGGQIHGNFTHDIDGGYIRVNFGYLDDQGPTALPVPVTTVNGSIQAIPGIDPRTFSFYSPNLGQDVTLNPNNTYAVTNFNTGFRSKDASIGFQLSKTFDNGVNVDDNFRYAAIQGVFMGLYPANNGSTVTGATWVTGPNVGQSYTGTAYSVVAFDTHLNNLGNVANDLKVSKTFDEGALGTFTPTAGFYVANQNLDLVWNFNSYLMGIDQGNAALLNSTTSIGGVGSGFGGCCDRTYHVSYLTTSPYFDLGWAIGNLTSDASVREDIQHASGWFNGAVLNNGSYQYLPSNQYNVNYSVHHTSYSVGTNYQFNPDLAVFARISDGVSFNADRIINPGQNDLNGSAPIPINEVQQYEGGVKTRYENFDAFVTLFDAFTSESNYDVTTQVASANKYHSYGAEIELGYVYDGLQVRAGTTYTHSRITSTNEAGAMGMIPQRQADWIFQISPSYTYGPVTVGGNVIGTTSSYGNDQNTIVMPGYALVNLFATYQVTPKLQAMITANNVTNAIAYSELDNIGGATAGAARAFDGRTVQASVRYNF
jgi:outer membrane receptor protein involved in Fe transport